MVLSRGSTCLSSGTGGGAVSSVAPEDLEIRFEDAGLSLVAVACISGNTFLERWGLASLSLGKPLKSPLGKPLKSPLGNPLKSPLENPENPAVVSFIVSGAAVMASGSSTSSPDSLEFRTSFHS